MPPKTYKDYSASYFKILDHFSISAEPLTLEHNDLKAINSRRRDIHRFFAAIANAENDSYAAELYKTSRELTLSINEGEKTLVIKLNEINDMLKKALPEEEMEEIEKKEMKEVEEKVEETKKERESEKDKIIARLKKAKKL